MNKDKDKGNKSFEQFQERVIQFAQIINEMNDRLGYKGDFGDLFKDIEFSKDTPIIPVDIYYSNEHCD